MFPKTQLFGFSEANAPPWQEGSQVGRKGGIVVLVAVAHRLASVHREETAVECGPAAKKGAVVRGPEWA